MRSCIVLGLPTHLVQELNVVTVQSFIIVFFKIVTEELYLLIQIVPPANGESAQIKNYWTHTHRCRFFYYLWNKIEIPTLRKLKDQSPDVSDTVTFEEQLNAFVMDTKCHFPSIYNFYVFQLLATLPCWS